MVVARFIPWVRTFTPILAGVARMPYRRFLVANVAGALVWGAGLVTLGHLAHSVAWLKVRGLRGGGRRGRRVVRVAGVGWVPATGVARVRRRPRRQPRPSSARPKT